MSMETKMKTVIESVTILAGDTVSSVLNMSYYKYMCIFLPSNWVTSDITFTGCATVDGTFLSVIHADDLGAVTIASIAASKLITLNGEILEAMIAIPFLRLVAGTTQAATDKIIKIGLKR